MATVPVPMDDTVAVAMQQGFAQNMQFAQQEAARENSGFGNVAEQTRLGFLKETSLSDLADGILAQRSAGGQPQSNAGYAGVNAGNTSLPVKA